jgi:nicotinate phosphoribosyltransferase
LPLFADLYEFTMLEAYHALGMGKQAVFSLFVRKLPPDRKFLIACGLDDLLDDVQALHFTHADIEHLASFGLFQPRYLEWLHGLRFTGEVHAVAEGTPVFPNEPILEVIAPIGEAQMLETLVINQIGFQTLIASKAARIASAAGDRRVVDFGTRRSHGIDAAIKGARAAYIGGAAATSNVEAGRRYGIPVTGTVAHSFIQAFPNELEAFRAFASLYPDTTLLVDTYETPAAVATVIALARELGPEFRVRAIRLDSGDLLELSRNARLSWTRLA